MGMIYYSYSGPTYEELWISGTGYPSQGTAKGSFNTDVDPTSDPGWNGPFYTLGHNSLTKIHILDPVEITYGNSFFYNLSKVTVIDGIENIYGTMKSGYRMFMGLPLLTQDIVLQNIASVQTTSLESMFEGTGVAGINIDVSVLDTTNVTNTAKMFKDSGAKAINMTGLSMLDVVDAHEMFSGCGLLKNISGTDGIFRFTQCINSTNMFYGDTGLPNFDPSKIDKTLAISKDSGGYITMSPEAETLIEMRIQNKYDTKANWYLYDPSPLKGEVCIEKDGDRIRLKVGDGLRSYSELPYANEVAVDSETVKLDSQGIIYLDLDSETVFVGADGKIHSAVQLVDSETVFKDADGKIELHIDNSSITVNSDGKLQARESIDGETVVRNADSELSVPIDGVSIYLDTDGKLKAKGTVGPGTGLKYDAADTTKLDVVTDDATIGIQANALAVNYDGDTIYWDTSVPGLYNNGALRSVVTRSFDDTIKEEVVNHNYMLSIPIDNDTIAMVGGKMVATTQVPGVEDPIVLDNSEITLAYSTPLKVDSGKLTVDVDNDTIKVVDGKLVGNAKITATKPVSITNNDITLDIDDTLQITGGKLGAKPLTAASPLKISGNEVTLEVGAGLELDASGKLKSQIVPSADGKLDASAIPVDSDTLTVEDGKLKANYAEASGKGIVEKDGELELNVDSSNVYLTSDGKLSSKTYSVMTEAPVAVTTTAGDHSSTFTVKLNYDDDTLKAGSRGLYARYQTPKVDDETVIINNAGLVEANLDHVTLEYNESEDFVEVISNELKPENGIYMRDATDDSGDVYIGVNWGSEFAMIDDKIELRLDDSLTRDSEGKIKVAAPVVGIAPITVKQENNCTYVGIDIDSETLTISEGKLKASKQLTAGEGININGSVISAQVDNETVYVDLDNNIKTYIGGGYTGTKAPVTISKGDDVAKRRNYEKTEYDEAEYVLNTINFPSTTEYGNTLSAVVSGDSIFGTAVELQFNYVDGQWIGYTDDGDRIIVKQTETVVTCNEKFDDAPATASCTIQTREQTREIAYVDNTFIKVDSETVYVNSEGALAAKVKDIKSGIAAEVVDLRVNVLYDSETIELNDNKIGAKYQVNEDESTIKRNDDDKLEVQVDRGLDISTGKVGHISVGPAVSGGTAYKVPQIQVDAYGHTTSVTEVPIASMVGATVSTAGTAGFVPVPLSTDRAKFLRGDGTWAALVNSSQYEVRIVEQTVTLSSDGQEYEFNMSSYVGSTAIAPLSYYCRTASELASVNFMCLTESNTDKMVLFIKGNSGAKLTVACQWLCVKS